MESIFFLTVPVKALEMSLIFWVWVKSKTVSDDRARKYCGKAWVIGPLGKGVSSALFGLRTGDWGFPKNKGGAYYLKRRDGS